MELACREEGRTSEELYELVWLDIFRFGTITSFLIFFIHFIGPLIPFSVALIIGVIAGIVRAVRTFFSAPSDWDFWTKVWRILVAFVLPQLLVIGAALLAIFLAWRPVASTVLATVSLVFMFSTWAKHHPIYFYREWLFTAPHLKPETRRKRHWIIQGSETSAGHRTYTIGRSFVKIFVTLLTVLFLIVVVPAYSPSLAIVLIFLYALFLNDFNPLRAWGLAKPVLSRFLTYGEDLSGAAGVWIPETSVTWRRRLVMATVFTFYLSLSSGLCLYFPSDIVAQRLQGPQSVTDVKSVYRMVWDQNSDTHEGRRALFSAMWRTKTLTLRITVYYFVLPFVLAMILPNLLILGLFRMLLLRSEELREKVEGLDRDRRTEWQWYVDRLKNSSHVAVDPYGRELHEADHLFLGLEPALKFPVLIDRKILSEHCYIVGATGSGKTALGIMPLLIQLMRGGGKREEVVAPSWWLRVKKKRETKREKRKAILADELLARHFERFQREDFLNPTLLDGLEVKFQRFSWYREAKRRQEEAQFALMRERYLTLFGATNGEVYKKGSDYKEAACAILEEFIAAAEWTITQQSQSKREPILSIPKANEFLNSFLMRQAEISNQGPEEKRNFINQFSRAVLLSMSKTEEGVNGTALLQDLIQRARREEHYRLSVGDLVLPEGADPSVPPMDFIREQAQSWGRRKTRQQSSPSAPIVIIDLKGDPALFHTARIEARRRGQKFLHFTLEQGKTTHLFNPFQSFATEHRTLIQLCNLFLDSLSLNHGDNYGKSFYSRQARLLLFDALEDEESPLGRRPQTFEELLVTIRYKLASKQGRERYRDTYELVSTVHALTQYKQLVTSPEQQADPNGPVIHMPTVIEEGQVVYFWLPSAIESISVREVGKLALFCLLSAAIDRQREGRETKQIYLIADEFQRLAGENFKVILEQARSYGISAILANQTLSDLKDRDWDLRPTIRTNTRLQLYFSATDALETKQLTDISGEELVEFLSYSDGVGTMSWIEKSEMKSRTWREELKSRLSRNDIARVSDHPLEFIAYVTRGSGYTQFGGLPFPVRTSWPIPWHKYERRQRMKWPRTGVVTNVDTPRQVEQQARITLSDLDRKASNRVLEMLYRESKSRSNSLELQEE